MNAVLALLQDAAFWTAVPASAAPLVIGTTGALLCARAGILQLGSEGVFMLGALTGLLAAQHGVEPWSGLLAAAAAGLLAGLVQGLLTGPLGLPQPLTGIALTLVGVSVAQAAWPATAAPAAFFQPLDVPAVSYLSAIETLFRQQPPVYLAVLLAAIVAFVLDRTPLGLAIRACGENPLAVAVQGRSVHGLRTGTVMAGSAMIAAAGGSVALMASAFVPDAPLSGRGFLCLALAAAAGWRPGLAFAGALVFGAIDAAIPLLAQDLGVRAAPMAIAPYLLAIVALAVTRRRLSWPSALLAPYRAGGNS